jgi:hypothetical protein
MEINGYRWIMDDGLVVLGSTSLTWTKWTDWDGQFPIPVRFLSVLEMG